MYRIIVIFLIVKTSAAIQLGRIQNANWILNLSHIDNEYINISNTTCDQCLCRMLAMNDPTISIACQQKLRTCQLLFWNATAQLQTDEISVVYIQTIPKFLQMTINQEPMATSTTTATTAVPVFLGNPGGELGSLSPWTSSSSSSPILDNGMANAGSTHPYDGLYDFYGGYGGGSLNQKVPLTNTFSTTQLDSSSLYASISFWERSANQTPPDTAQVILIFLSATNNSLSSVTTGPKNCILAWYRVTRYWLLPVGTRTIDYVMTFVANYGLYADAWIDDNILNID